MERIFLYIGQEIDQSISSREEKLLVAEFGFLDTLLTLTKEQLDAKQVTYEEFGITANTLSTSSSTVSSSKSIPTSDYNKALTNNPVNFHLAIGFDETNLEIITKDIADLKSRLGFTDEVVGNFFLEWSQIQTWFREIIAKVKMGAEFYIKGTKLLGSDLQYAFWLFKRAFQGYTLKPREVRTLQRTGKDLITLIPFTIILIIPLTPVGHVLIFSLIQRIFPDFFPSTFTERRQNLSKMYDDIDKKSIDGSYKR